MKRNDSQRSKVSLDVEMKQQPEPEQKFGHAWNL